MKYSKIIIRLIIATITLVVLIDFSMSYKARHYVFDDLETIQNNKVGLVLGAGKYTSHGNINLYYKYRLEAAIRLYKAGKIEFILVSGDNGRKDYDEPSDFKNDLIKRGIPARKIVLDYAGFRTLDSVVRAKEIFGLSEFTIISQKFHNERALFLAKSHNIKAIAFNAKDIRGRFGLKTNLREYLARTKAAVDILFHVKPKFLGKKIEIS
ncbi:ElyC/SanA/YdcF family protein [Algibacter sp. 2305UL17-15]|uniref:SanA/YdcF family protein n=1 Tax=Algibacter sp. 2305UL17-15 TaxID=3231268 RepID=UPI003457E124